jgi:hypothetical protein
MARETLQDKERRHASDELDELMDGLGDGTLTIKCTRLDPPLGYCGDFFVTQANPITLKEIKRRFGGRVFQLNTRSSNGQIKKQKTITIDDVPKREGIEILPDGSNAQPQNTAAPDKKDEPSALETVMNAGLPPKVLKTVLPYLVGLGGMLPDESQQPQQNRYNQNFELMQQQAMMEMMNAQMRQNMEFQREMQKFKREQLDEEKPKNPFSDMENIFKMMREIQGFKSEIGGEGNLASTALQSTMDLMGSGLSEWLSLKKLQMQAEIAKATVTGQQATALPKRSTTPELAQPQLSEPKLINQGKDPVKIAQEMGQMFRELDDSTKQQVLNAFLGDATDEPENIEQTAFDDTIENEGDFLNPDDERILKGETVADEHEGDHIPDSQHAASVDDNDQTDRQRDPGGEQVSTH